MRTLRARTFAARHFRARTLHGAVSVGVGGHGEDGRGRRKRREATRPPRFAIEASRRRDFTLDISRPMFVIAPISPARPRTAVAFAMVALIADEEDYGL